MNLTVTSNGVQFDRLGIMYLGDVEVFRTSTAEPGGNNIIWTYVKEMDHYYALWKTPQKIIFDLGNLINEKYTGAFNITLTATFFTVPGAGPYADTILPISSRSSGADQGSAFHSPGEPASATMILPRNLQRAVVSISANGQGVGEEFWYTNTFDNLKDTFKPTIGALNGKSPDRRILLYIDKQLAGMILPFPVIFTGGIAPSFWRRIVGIQAFDLKEHEIDVTPFLPLLCDGKPHTFDIRVVGWTSSVRPSLTTTNPFWVVSGKIFLFLDQAGTVTTGVGPISQTNKAPSHFEWRYTSSDPDTHLNETLSWSIDGPELTLEHKSRIELSTGTWDVEWSQKIAVDIRNDMSQQGIAQRTELSHKGEDQALRKPVNGTNDTESVRYHTKYAHKLNLTTSFETAEFAAFGITAHIGEFLFDIAVTGPSVFPTGLEIGDELFLGDVTQSGITERQLALDRARPTSEFTAAKLSSRLSGDASYVSTETSSRRYGKTDQSLSFARAKDIDDPGTEIYSRHVTAENLSVIHDEEILAGKPTHTMLLQPVEEVGVIEDQVGIRSIREILGRGFGIGVDGELVQATPVQGASLMLGNSDVGRVHRAQGFAI